MVRNLAACVWSLLALVGFCASSLVAQSTTWNAGGGTVLWIDPLNWSNGVPTATMDAIVPTGTITMPSTTAATGAACRTLTVHGSLTLAPGYPLAVYGDALVQPGATVGGSASLRFVGTSQQQLRLSSSCFLTCDVECAVASGTNFYISPLSGSSFLGGAFKMSSGALNIVGSTATVAKDMTFSGGTCTGTLEVNGNFLATAPTPFGALLTCRKNYSAVPGFTLTDRVTFDGGINQTIASVPAGSGVTLKDLRIASGTTVTTAEVVTVTGSAIFVSGTLTTTGTSKIAFTGSNEVHVTAGGRIEGPGQLRFLGTSGNQQLRLDMSGTVTCDVECAVATGINFYISPLTGSSFLGGAFKMSSGALNVVGSTATVAKDMTFSGGTCTGTLVVNGNFLATSPTPFGSLLTCRKNYSAVPGFTLTDRVTFDGGMNQTIASVPAGSGVTLKDFTIASGATVTTAEVVKTTGSSLFVDGTVTVESGGRLEFTGGNEVHVRTAGKIEGAGSLRFVSSSGNQQLRTDTTGKVNCDVECVQTGGIFYFSPLAGPGTVLGGALRLSSGVVNFFGTLDIAGNLGLDGGSISGSQITVGKDVVATAAVPVAAPLLCNGSWIAHPSFSPTQPVTLGGSGRTSVRTLGALGSDVKFAALTIKTGTRVVANDLRLAATSCTIESTGKLLAGANAQLSFATLPTVQGTLGAEAGGTLVLQPAQSLTIASGATLSLLGTPTALATVTGAGTGGYGLTVAGNLEAQNFLFEKMGAQGIVIQQGATIAPAPNDLRGGYFDNPATGVSASLLDIRRPTATNIRYTRFERSNAQGTNNVRCLGGAKITFTNWSGAFAGSTYEIDPLALVDWGPAERTAITAFAAKAGAAKVTLSWTSTSEIDLASYVLERGPSASGPFLTIATYPPQGPSFYQHVDTPLTPETVYHYRLVQKLTHGVFDVLATASATPWCATLPPNVLTVGVGGTFTDLQSAVNAISQPRTVLYVKAGTYQAFTIQAPPQGGVRVVADGSGPVVIDTSAGPVRILSTGPLDAIEFSGLVIGSATTTQPALVVQNSLGTLVLDGLTIQGGVGKPGLWVTASSQIAVQRCTLAGTPGMLGNGSTLVASLGSLDRIELQASSRATLVELVPGSKLVDGTSTLSQPTGIMPTLTAPRFPGLTVPFTFDFKGFPTSPWFLLVAGNLQFFDLGLYSDSPLLVELGTLVSLNLGSTDGSGLASLPFVVPPSCPLIGFPLPFQAASLDLANPRLRLSNVLSVMAVP